MQQLQEELKNEPTNASQVCSSSISELNRDKTSYPSRIEAQCSENMLACNGVEVNQAQQTERPLQTKVFVLNKQGLPLMPCSYAKSKRMVKKEAAKVVKRFPFTIQLNFECENKVQEVNLGIDTGYGNIGFSATTQKEELIAGTLVLDGKTKERLDEKRMYRRFKRSRHHWYRKPRFLNRTKKENWLPPSIERRYQTHLNLINRVKSVLPISNIILEIAKFDIQKLENPEINGIEYQQGDLYQYLNLVSYLKTKQNNICLFCKKEFKSGDSKTTHHIYSMNDKRRTDRPDGLVLLHKDCHTGDKGIHKTHQEKMLHNKVINQYKDSTFMNIIRKRFLKDIPNLKATYGYITALKRYELNIEKSHSNDAFVISNWTNQKRCKILEIKQVHRNNRVLQLNRKGFKPSIKRNKSKINPYDLFWINKNQYICKGMFNKGTYVRFGNNKKEYVKFSDITKIFNFESFIWN